MTHAKNKLHIKKCLYVLKVFNIVQPYTILLSAYKKYDETRFAKICHYLTVFCIRYQAICSLPAKDIEKHYNKIAICIYQGEDVHAVKELLKLHYPSDNDFKSAFVGKTLSTTQSNKKVNYLLTSIEDTCSPSNPILFPNSYTVEHILPKKGANNDEYWREQFADLLEQNIQRLGNLTLLTDTDNRESNCNNFIEKKKILQKSKLKIVQKICTYKDWNIDTINDYQNWLADIAIKTWNLNDNANR